MAAQVVNDLIGTFHMIGGHMGHGRGAQRRVLAQERVVELQHAVGSAQREVVGAGRANKRAQWTHHFGAVQSALGVFVLGCGMNALTAEQGSGSSDC